MRSHEMDRLDMWCGRKKRLGGSSSFQNQVEDKKPRGDQADSTVLCILIRKLVVSGGREESFPVIFIFPEPNSNHTNILV